MDKSTGLVRIWYQTIKKRLKRVKGKPWISPKVVLLLLIINMCADADSLMCHPDRPFPCNDGSICYTQKEKCDGKKFCADNSDEDKCICSIPQIANAIPDKAGLLMEWEDVTYKCAKGFKKMGGVASRRCRGDGSLWGSPLVCKVPPVCKAKDVPEVCDSYFSHYPTSCKDDSSYTSKVCNFTCSSLDECRQLKPKCTIEQTENSTPDKNGQIQQGEIVTYKCANGFFPKEGDAVRGCQRDGTLTGRKLLCKAPNNCIEKRFGTRTLYKPVWYRFTNISTVIQSVVVKENLYLCNFEDFGFSGLGLWAKDGCDAIFTVCFEEETKNCPENEKCIPKARDGSHQGNVKQCLHKKLYCDSAYNCDDGMDENCVSFCAEHEWRCHDKRKCVKASRVCTDKEKPDCFDGSDEDPEFCFSETSSTAPSRTGCKMGNVVENTRGDWAFKFTIESKTSPNNVEDCKQICMANPECGATSFHDYLKCRFYTIDVKTQTDKYSVFSKKVCQECTEDYHKWRRRLHPRKGICIHATKFCNGTGSYSKWDTEVNCKGSMCPVDYKKCADDLQCLHEDKFCDGNVDCNDRSDEECENTAVGTSARALHIVLVMVLAYFIF